MKYTKEITVMSSFKSTKTPKYPSDLSKNKYESRYDRLMNILFYAKELPSDLHTQMNMSYDNFRKTISILRQRGLISKINKDGFFGYQLTLSGKKMPYEDPRYEKYRDCVEEEIDRHHSAKRRSRKRQFAYLYALFDRAGIIYETFIKPSIKDVKFDDHQVYFYTALDFKRMLGIESTTFIGSRLLGFLVGKGRIITVYRTNYELKTFGRQEALVPELLKRYFSVAVNTAILICEDDGAAMMITHQIIESNHKDAKGGVNTARYRYFYVLPSTDKFLSCYQDLFADHTEKQQRIIDRYHIDTSERDSRGGYRYITGTGYIGRNPVWVCAGVVNVVTLRAFLYNAEMKNIESYIFCNRRDVDYVEEFTQDTLIDVIAI